MPQLRVKVDRRDIEGVISGLKWISSPPFISKAFALPKIKRKILEHLRSIFPVSDPRWQHTSHLVTGFRTYDVPESQGRVGFVLQHARAKLDQRVQTILTSLERGSRGYYRFPEEITGSGGEGRFAFKPGDGRGIRHGSAGGDFAMKKRIHIPGRPGQNYMGRTLEFAQDLVLEAKPEFFKQVKQAIKEKRGK